MDIPDLASVTLVGLAEISGLLGVPPATVASWRQRGLLPKPRWQLMAGPVWTANEIHAWHEHEKGTPAPDRVHEALDLSAEPHRAAVFAHYGLAMGEAQMVEHHLATVITLLHPPPQTRLLLHKIIEEAEAKTMGALKDELRRSGAPVIGIDKLKAVVEKRNLLAHRFFREPNRSVKMTTDEGRQELILELDEAAREFWLTAQYLRAVEVRLAMQRGLSKHDVIERVRSLRTGGGSDAPSDPRRVLITDSPEVESTIHRAFVDAQDVPDIPGIGEVIPPTARGTAELTPVNTRPRSRLNRPKPPADRDSG